MSRAAGETAEPGAIVVAALVALVAFTVGTRPAVAADPGVALPGGGGELRLAAADARVNLQSGAFSASGGVRITRPGSVVTGDSANGNFKRRIITVHGHVVVRQAPAGPATGRGTGESPIVLRTETLTVAW